MAAGRRKKGHLSDNDIRKRVGKVMDHWASFPSFARLFDALLVANDNYSDKEFAIWLSHLSGRSYGQHVVDQIRSGTTQPNYQFIRDLLDFDTLRLGDAAVRPDGSRRAAIFAAAGLTEVTHESVSQWNREVLASLEKTLENPEQSKRPQWGDVMSKLITFHAQGGRETHGQLANRAFPDGEGNRLRQHKWISAILSNRFPPNCEQRAALARAVGLASDQINYLEGLIEGGVLLVAAHKQPTVFRTLLCDALLTLKGHGFTAVDVARYSTTVAIASGITNDSIYDWRCGRSAPTLEGLRGLIRGLAKCVDYKSKPILSRVELERLVVSAGFQPRQLTDTTHVIIARITDKTELGPLLKAIRMAADVSIPLSAIEKMNVPRRTTQLPSEAQINYWEHGDAYLPTRPQVLELLERYNTVIAARGFPPLSQEEIAGVLQVTDRNRAQHDATYVDKLRKQRKPLSSRFRER